MTRPNLRGPPVRAGPTVRPCEARAGPTVRPWPARAGPDRTAVRPCDPRAGPTCVRSYGRARSRTGRYQGPRLRPNVRTCPAGVVLPWAVSRAVRVILTRPTARDGPWTYDHRGHPNVRSLAATPPTNGHLSERPGGGQSEKVIPCEISESHSLRDFRPAPDPAQLPDRNPGHPPELTGRRQTSQSTTLTATFRHV
jgi:hypothetical protein